MQIICDCDDTVINHISIWLGLYNKDYNDTLSKEQLTDWDIVKFVKPECGIHIYDYLSRATELYSQCKPVPFAKKGVDYLKSQGHRVIFATINNFENAKYRWLLNHGFINGINDFAVLGDKSILRGDLIIEDNYHYVKSFHGAGILIDSPWNAKYEYQPRVKGWREIITMFETGKIK
jgi:5'-nucleotidase